MRRCVSHFACAKSALFACVFGALSGCATQAAMTEVSVVAAGDGMRYLVARPKRQRAPDTGWPLILFLHGRGEIGGELANVKTHGPIQTAATQPDFPFLIVAPHLEAGDSWRPNDVLAVLDDVEERWPIDSARIYLTGLSLGGHGTWATAAAMPDRFAAIAPVSGRGNEAMACRLVALPIWAFHGVADEVVNASDHQAMVDAVRACGGRPGLSLYPDVGHDAWTRAYADPTFYEWLMLHTRGE